MLSTVSKFRFPLRNRTLAIFATIALIGVASAPARAVTCEDVRHLSSAEQDYWSKRLNLSGEQRHQIWVACYRDYHPQRGPEQLVQR